MEKLTLEKFMDFVDIFDYKKLSIFCNRDIKNIPHVLNFIKNEDFSNILNLAFSFQSDDNFKMDNSSSIINNNINDNVTNSNIDDNVTNNNSLIMNNNINDNVINNNINDNVTNNGNIYDNVIMNKCNSRRNNNSLIMNNNIDDNVIINNYSSIMNSNSVNILKTKSVISNNLKEKRNNIFIVQTFLYTLLSNPFDFDKILEIEEIIKFVTENIIKEKLSLKICVKVTSIEYLLKNTSFNIYLILKEFCKIKKLHKQILQFVCFKLTKKTNLNKENEKNLCKKTINKFENLNLHEFDFVITKLENEEYNTTSLICSFKILSYQYKHYPDLITPNMFFIYLNYNNFKFGYCLCRSFLRIIKYFKVEEISDYIQSLLLDIFANEMLWINCFQILGSLVFKNYNIQLNMEIIKKAILYSSDDVNYRSCLLREYALFYIYAFFRKEPHVELINILIYVSIFDTNYKIRRIASSILSPYFNFNIAVKRKEDLLQSFYTILTLFNVDINDYLSMTSNDVITIDLKNHIINKYKLKVDKEQYKNTVHYYLDLGYDCKYGYLYNNTLQHMNKFFELDIKKVYNYRYSNILISLYIEVLILSLEYKYVFKNEDLIVSNILFMLTKNINNIDLHNVIWMFNREDIYEWLWKNRKRSSYSIIVSNIKNTKYINYIIDDYKRIISLNTNIDYINNIYKALMFFEGDLMIFKSEISNGLENYFINEKGDVCYEIRLSSLLLLKAISDNNKLQDTIKDNDKVKDTICDNNTVDNIIIGNNKVDNIIKNYLVRYLVDKSKFIRDYLNQNLCEFKYVIDHFEILSKGDICLILQNMELFDELNVTIGILGYLSTSDNYKFQDILTVFISKIEVIDKNIRILISTGYKRVFGYIRKISLYIQERQDILLVKELCILSLVKGWCKLLDS